MPSSPDLAVRLGSLELPNPILVASGTFGYAKEMEWLVELAHLGGILPKTITRDPRIGNPPWRTVETSAGLLNAIGLDNDGIDYFLQVHWPYLRSLSTKVIVSVAGKSEEDFVYLVGRLHAQEGMHAIELNISCPNVSGGVDFGTDCQRCERVIAACRQATDLPLLAKLTPNVTSIADMAAAAEQGGADAISCINTVLGTAIDWRKRRPLLGNGFGGLSGPAIKPIALRCVVQVSRRVQIPIIGIGGIQSIDDVMEFLAAGATAIQIGTANYYDPTLATRLVAELPAALAEANVASVREFVGSVQWPQ